MACEARWSSAARSVAATDSIGEATAGGCDAPHACCTTGRCLKRRYLYAGVIVHSLTTRIRSPLIIASRGPNLRVENVCWRSPTSRRKR